MSKIKHASHLQSCSPRWAAFLCSAPLLWPLLCCVAMHDVYPLPCIRPPASASTTTASSRACSCRTRASRCPTAPTYHGKQACQGHLPSYVQVCVRSCVCVCVRVCIFVRLSYSSPPPTMARVLGPSQASIVFSWTFLPQPPSGCWCCC